MKILVISLVLTFVAVFGCWWSAEYINERTPLYAEAPYIIDIDQGLGIYYFVGKYELLPAGGIRVKGYWAASGKYVSGEIIFSKYVCIRENTKKK